MVVFSSLFRLAPRVLNKVNFRKMSDHREFTIAPTRYAWDKFKDLLHFYVLIGAIPCGLVIMYANIFIGPATLSEIPEGYVPKHWEYIRHPVSRFIGRYILTSQQEDYEKYLAFIFLEQEKCKLRKLENDIKKKMAERNDYQVYYYRPIMAKYLRQTRELADSIAKTNNAP